MRAVQLVRLAGVTFLVLIPQTVFGQARAIDVRASWGYSTPWSDTASHAVMGSGSVTVATSRHTRFGVEVGKANQGIRYGRAIKRRVRFFAGIWEYEFSPGQHVNPYMGVGFGFAHYLTFYPRESREPGLPAFWEDRQGRYYVHTTLGVRWFLSRHVFVAPDVRISFLPFLRSTVAVGYAF